MVQVGGGDASGCPGSCSVLITTHLSGSVKAGVKNCPERSQCVGLQPTSAPVGS